MAPYDVAFPEAIPGRTAAPSSGGAGAAPSSIHIPRTRLFQYSVSANAGTRSTVSSPQVKGPAIIKAAFIEFNGGADPPAVSLEIGYNPTPVVEENIATTTVKGWSVFSEKVDEATPLINGVHQGFIQWSIFNTRPRAPYPLNQLIQLDNFRIIFSLINGSGVAVEGLGWIEVIEDIDPAALAGFR